MTEPASVPGPRPKVGGRGLTLQLLLFAVLPLTLLLVVIAYGSLVLHSEAMRTLVAEREARAGHAAADAIAGALHQRGLSIQSLAVLAGQTDDPLAALAASDYMQGEFEGGLAITGPKGEVLATTSAAAWWAAQDLAGLLARSRASGAPEFAAARPLSSDEPPLTVVVFAGAQGSAAGAVRPASVAGNVLDDAFPPATRSQAWLVDSRQQTLYRSNATMPALDVAGHPGLAAALDGEGGVAFLDFQGEEHVLAFNPIPPLGWVLVMEEPWESVDNPLLRQTQAAPLVLIPALLVSLVALAFAIRQVVQPLRALESKSAEVGRGDFQALEEPVGGIREIKSLQQTMVQMAARLRVYQQSVRRYAGAVTRSQEDERRRVARELHDDTIQALIALDQRTQLAQMAVRGNTADAAEHLAELRRLTQSMLKSVRRVIAALRPIYLEDLGLPAALQMLAQDAGSAAGVQVDIISSGESRRLSPEQEIAVYRIAQEALSNVVRHAQARSASVETRYEPGRFTLVVRDDGVGFAVPAPPADLDTTLHYGLMGMQERAELVGARLTLVSSPGGGTRLTLEVPL
jgi:two-component system sensor histidine kinase UhpB